MPIQTYFSSYDMNEDKEYSLMLEIYTETTIGQ